MKAGLFASVWLLCVASVGVCAAQSFVETGWTEPVPLAEVNSDLAEDWSPQLSPDGLTLYFARVRSDTSYYGRIFQARREVPFGPFTGVEEVAGDLNASDAHVVLPWVSPDGLRMYYCWQQYGRFQLKRSERESVEAPWPAGESLAELNELGTRLQTPRLTPDERVIFFDAQDIPGGRGGYDIWTASRPDRDAPFADVRNLEELNTEWGELAPWISTDGLTLLFQSDRNGELQLFVASRQSPFEAFGNVEHLSMFDTPGGKSLHPCLTQDGKGLYFARQQGADRSTLDIWFSQRIGAFYVDGALGDDSDDGLSPETAFSSIQRAIDEAADGDVVNVYPGTYREGISFLGKAITVRSAGDAAVLEAPDDFAVSFYMGEGRDSVLKNVVIANSYVGIFITGGAPTITNVTVVNNEFGIEAYRDAEPRIGNSILWNNVSSDLYGCSARYSCIQRQADGAGNFADDPMFVDPNNGDYHLLSARGRYWPAHDVWVLDDATSPCVDAGDPDGDFSREPRPNGGRLNLGAYGGTAFASMSEPPFSLDLNEDGVVNEADLDLFVDLWEERTREEPVPSPPLRR